MRVVVLHAEATIAEITCDREAIYAGSQEDCRLLLDDERISPRQLVLYPAGQEGWIVEPLNADCQLQLNGQLLTEKAEINNGDELQICDYQIRVFPEETTSVNRQPVSTSRAQLERFAQARLPAGTIVRRLNEPFTVPPAQLESLGRANVAVSGWTTIEEFLDAALQTLLGTLAAQRVWIGLRRMTYGPMEYEEGRLLTGQPTDMPKLAEELKPRVLDRGQFLLVPRISREERVAILAGPLLGPDSTLGMVWVDTGTSGRRYDQRALEHFVLLLNIFAYQLDAIFRATARNRAAMIEGQVSVAHEIQQRLTPRKLPQWENALQFAAFREPGRERSGDIYDVVRLANDLAAFMIAHTTATGALPSMLMAQAQTAFRSGVMHQDNAAVCLRMLNWMTFDGQKDHPLSCFIGVIDPKSGLMRYSVAGDSGAYVIDQRGEERRLGALDPTPPLSMQKGTVYPLLSEELEPGDTIVLYTPGVVTASNRQEETFGEERFINILCDGFGQTPSAMLKEMLTDLRSFTEGGAQPDDITVLLGHRV